MRSVLLIESDFSSVAAAFLVVAASSLILKSFGFKGAPVFAALSVVFIISYTSGRFSAIGELFNDISSYSNASEYVSAAMKVVGIGYLGGISSDVCKEIGEAGVAKGISVAARLEILLISLPFVKDLLELSVSLIGE